MPLLNVLATYLPPWGAKGQRLAGPDEDALTLAVSAGRLARDAHPGPIDEVVLITRDLPGLEGGTEAILLAGLGLPRQTRCVIQLGGPPAALSALCAAEPGALIIAVDVVPAAAAAAAVIGDPSTATSGRTELQELPGSEGSLPVRVRTTAGGVFDYEDPRLLRVRGTGAARERLGLDDKPVAMAGLTAKETVALVQGTAAALPSTGAAAALFALADAIDRGVEGVVVAVEQASAAAARLWAGATPVVRHEPAVQAPPVTRPGAPASIPISLSAYDRAFDSKLGLQAGRCSTCGTLALPPRLRCLECGSEADHELTPLPRQGRVYTIISVFVPVPGLATPYDLAIIEIGDTGRPPADARHRRRLGNDGHRRRRDPGAPSTLPCVPAYPTTGTPSSQLCRATGAHRVPPTTHPPPTHQ